MRFETPIRSSMETKFNYKKEENKFVIYQNDTCVLTPQGNKVCTVNKALASELVKALNKGEDFGDAASILCFHYTILDSRQDEEEIMQEEVETPYEMLMNDPYLMFRQTSPIRQVIAQYFCDALPEHVSKLPFHKRLAFMTMSISCQAYMLPFYIDNDIIGQDDVEACKEEFFDDLIEYLYDLFDTKKKAKAFLKQITPVINTYVKYMSYDEV